ncbi:hypothetical protein ANO14919_022580 [Xylariales sp. No.14919]|nr:hypothetical protein ANO14919_022580 [Xylariales sp. No.14919]
MPEEVGGISSRGYLGVGITLVLITAIFVTARVIANMRGGNKLRIDDGISVLSVALVAGVVAVSFITVNSLNAPMVTPDYYAYALQRTQALNWISGLSIWCSKAPVLFLFVNLFGIRTSIRVASYTVMIILAIAVLAAAGTTSARCKLNSDGLTPELFQHCSTTAATASVALGLVSVLADVVILVLPIHVVWQLNLSRHKKVGLVVIFASGILAIVSSAVAVNYKWRAEKGSHVNLKDSLIGVILENCIATIVGSVPSAYAFWQQIFSKNGLCTRLRAALFSPQRSDSAHKLYGNGGRPCTSTSSEQHVRRKSTDTSSVEDIIVSYDYHDTLPLPSRARSSHSTVTFLDDIVRK